MLRELSIKNFAIIDDLKMHFSKGLTIFSGETGAGKSIIINAFNLILGARASAKLIRTGADSCELEAFFEINAGSHAAKRMAHYGFDGPEALLIRRIISRKNRHRIYINGHLSTIQILTDITEKLASISGQHAHQLLLKEEHHLIILDRFAGLLPLREKVRMVYQDMLPEIQRLKQWVLKQNNQAQHMELLGFQKKEIEAAAIAVGEDEALELERTRLKNAEKLYQTVYTSVDALYNDRGAVIEKLSEVKNALDTASAMDSSLSEITAKVAECAIEIEDTSDRLRDYLSKLAMDDQRLETIEDRLDLLNKLKRKYGGSLKAVFAHLEHIQAELSDVLNLTDRIKEAHEKLDHLKKKLVKLAGELSRKRIQAASIMDKSVEKELATLKMPQVKFHTAIESVGNSKNPEPYFMTENRVITDTGYDNAEFLIATNVGEALKPLANIASGGELSRIVLALKAILAESDAVETVVFDEVDAGIGGGVAEVVGRKLSGLSQHHQILCITHLPQIARFADQHFRVSKQVAHGRTNTMIQALDKIMQVEEIARMLGGETITQTTLDHANELLNP